MRLPASNVHNEHRRFHFVFNDLAALGESISRACRVIAMYSFDGLVGAIRGLGEGVQRGWRRQGEGASDILELYSYELFINVPGVKQHSQFSPKMERNPPKSRPIAPDIFPKRDISAHK